LWLWIWLVFLWFTTGVFEEGGRFLALRYVKKPPHPWAAAVLFGIGHGGLEAWRLGAVAMIGDLVLLWTPEASLPEVVLTTRKMLLGLSAVNALPVLVERLTEMTAHVALTLMVVRAFRPGAKAWAWVGGAVGANAGLTTVAMVLTRVAGVWVAEAGLVFCAAGAVWWIFHSFQTSLRAEETLTKT
jgi:uncharacterized membrane protein YhfC